MKLMIKLIKALTIASTTISVCNCFALNCRPSLFNKTQNYIIGYGSLMQANSRQRTNPKANVVYPIMINSFMRAWGIHGDTYKTTFLTVLKHRGSSLNAVYYPADASEVKKTDMRERGYCRYKVKPKQIKALGSIKLPEGNFWIYAQKNKLQPVNIKYPIVQSYVDIFLDGCMQVGRKYSIKNFAKMCIETTSGWPNAKRQGLWINDRVHPRRPFEIPNAVKIDKLLAKYFSDYYSHKIE